MKSDPRSGYYVHQLEDYEAFEPVALPPEPPVDLGGALLSKLATASIAVGRLDGQAQTLPDADLFLAMFVRQEALLSSQIEGTECTLDDVLAFELDERQDVPDVDVGEVVNYVAALNRGVDLLSELPLCNRLLREVHATLLRDGRGADKTPGEFRKTQNWIGPAGCSLAQATFVPPPVHVMQQAMSDLEKYLHESELPVLITAGLTHAQFETIHPFADGNGRTGRLLVSLLLQERGVLTKPVLYLSTYLKRHRTQYFEHLMAVREGGEWERWLDFFLDGVTESAEVATAAASAIHDLRDADRKRIGDAGGGTTDLRLLDSLYGQPLVNASWVAEHIGVTPTTSNKMLDRFSDVGVLREITGKKRYRVYRYDSYLNIFETPAGSAADETVNGD